MTKTSWRASGFSLMLAALMAGVVLLSTHPANAARSDAGNSAPIPAIAWQWPDLDLSPGGSALSTETGPALDDDATPFGRFHLSSDASTQSWSFWRNLAECLDGNADACHDAVDNSVSLVKRVWNCAFSDLLDPC